MAEYHKYELDDPSISDYGRIPHCMSHATTEKSTALAQYNDSQHQMQQGHAFMIGRYNRVYMKYADTSEKEYYRCFVDLIDPDPEKDCFDAIRRMDRDPAQLEEYVHSIVDSRLEEFCSEHRGEHKRRLTSQEKFCKYFGYVGCFCLIGAPCLCYWAIKDEKYTEMERMYRVGDFYDKENLRQNKYGSFLRSICGRWRLKYVEDYFYGAGPPPEMLMYHGDSGTRTYGWATLEFDPKKLPALVVVTREETDMAVSLIRQMRAAEAEAAQTQTTMPETSSLTNTLTPSKSTDTSSVKVLVSEADNHIVHSETEGFGFCTHCGEARRSPDDLFCAKCGTKVV